MKGRAFGNDARIRWCRGKRAFRLPGLAGLIRALAAGTALLASACFQAEEPGLQGPSTETIGLTGTAGLVGGAPAAGIRVLVRPASFLADTQEHSAAGPAGGEALTDAAGAWRLDSLHPGPYAVEFRSRAGLGALVLCTLRAGGGRYQPAPPGLLRPTAALRGRVDRPRAPGVPVFVQVRGLERITRVTVGTGGWSLEGLPAGSLAIRLFSADPRLGAGDLPAVLAAPGDSQDLGVQVLDGLASEARAAWPHARHIRIRTGAAGAAVAGDVTGFPLLVRLGAAEFPFDSAAPGGADLRFETADGRRLPYEVESWDAAGKRAAVWVRLDTVRGGDDTQSIRMLWGRKDAVDMSLGLSVFDSASGFHSVWHLGDRLGDAARAGSRLHAASPAATGPGTGPTLSATGFDGAATFLYAEEQYPGPQAFSLSVWVRASGPGKLLGFENYPQAGPSYFDRHVWVTSDGAFHFGVYTRDPPESASPYRMVLSTPPGGIDGGWHLLTAVQSPEGGQRLYLDGALAARDTSVVHAAAYTGRWLLGNGLLAGWPSAPATTWFLGDLDEVRVAHAAHSPDWIKLAYETQKPGSTVLLYLPD